MRRVRSNKNRPIHMGPYKTERLARGPLPDLSKVATLPPLAFRDEGDPSSILNAMTDYQATLDALRSGAVNKLKSEIPADPSERAEHLKSFGYFCDATMVGICELPEASLLEAPVRNPEIARLAVDLKTRQTKTLASGIDHIMADLRDAMDTPNAGIEGHTHAIVFLYENPRTPRHDEPGAEWIRKATAQRGALRANETASVIGNYLRILGWEATSHSATEADLDLGKLAVASGLVYPDLEGPFVGRNYGLAAISCTLEMASDAPLGPKPRRLGRSSDPYLSRRLVDGPHPFERLKRVEKPTTYIDEPNVPRVPKRTDMFARALFGDMGKAVQEKARGGHYVLKAAPSAAQRRALGAFVLLQDGEPAAAQPSADDEANAQCVKAASYWLGADAVGISRCPNWVWYSHDAAGDPIEPTHGNAISMIIDQGYETTSGSSGDDWIAVAQSMRAYLRFSLIGGVIARQIRNLGYEAKAHTVMDGEVLQPPLLLLSGLGEVSRIGEVILNPYLGPRLKSGVVTTNMPLAHDKPIDFGLQRFCASCNKCARECPSGAITAGPKLMFNGYETWKSDSQKCTTYRISTQGGAMCGRCMKTCPWNLEGLFAEAPFRWAASNLPGAAPVLAKLDDALGKGEINQVKKWWWDIELESDGSYRPAVNPVNARALQKDLHLKYEDQTLAVFPAPLAAAPWPYPWPMDREKGIEAYQRLITAEEYQKRMSQGDDSHLHRARKYDDAPVVPVFVSKVEPMAEDVTKFEFRAIDGGSLPEWTAGAHLDIVVAPDYLRQYSMSGNPSDRSVYQIGVQREEDGRGGSKLLHRIFAEGRRVFISKPINHFPLNEDATMSYLMGGGIGVTPMIAFAHRLHELGKPFELHYSVSKRNRAGFLGDLASVPWSGNVFLHISDEGSRADLSEVLQSYRKGAHVYTCGADRYMKSVLDAATALGYPEDAQHFEYFSVPELPEYENHPFILRLKDGREIAVSENETASDALEHAGVHVDVKCSDGICGVCQCGIVSGDIEHRDFVLSKEQRKSRIILCQSRAAKPGGVIELDL